MGERAPSHGVGGVGDSTGPDSPLPHVFGFNVFEEEQAVALPLIVGLEGGFNAVFFRIVMNLYSSILRRL
jgi:hypothetical protein